MINVGIIGATGYTGAELVKLLERHPETKITVLTSRQYSGIEYSDIYPSFKGVVDKKCEELDIERICEKADYIFTALPHKLPMEIVPKLLNQGKKIIDLSADFRFSDVSLYESYYQPHTSPELLEKSVYGLCEIYDTDIRNADIVGNPGCYPTTVLLALLPLIKEGLIETTGIISDSKSGLSGAGRSVSIGTHYCEVNETFKAYGLKGHRHKPEMEEILAKNTGKTVELTFIPHLIPITRGMLSTIYTDAVSGVTEKTILECYQDFYGERKFVRILNNREQSPEIKNVQYTNFCDIGFSINVETGKLIVLSAIDNLVKGASGQAVQNMNIMAGFDETTGLL